MNRKTTFAGAAAALLPWLKTMFPKQGAAIDAASSAALLLLGYFASDAVKKSA